MNLVVLVTDTFRADYLGCDGNTWIETPNLDKMAAEGVLFKDFYAEGLTASSSPVGIRFWTRTLRSPSGCENATIHVALSATSIISSSRARTFTVAFTPGSGFAGRKMTGSCPHPRRT